MGKHFYCRVLVVTVVLLHQVSAFLWYDDPTDSCSSSQATGTSIFCCSGQCSDGTGIQNPGLCQYVFDGCIDSSETPLCPSSQVMKTGPVNELLAFDRDIGPCWGGDECHWASNIWDWSCCDCPPGSVPETPGICEGASRYCVHCTAEDETLQYSAVTSSYLCNSPSVQQQECNLAQEVSTISGDLGLFTTLVGSICPTSKTLGVITTLLQDVISLQDAHAAPSTDSGITSAAAVAAISLIATVESLALGLGVGIVAVETLPVSAIIIEWYALICTMASTAGTVLTLTQKAAQGLADHKFCTKPSSKRSPAPATLEDTPSVVFSNLAIREGAYNPCSEFVSYFPGDFTLPATLDSDCDQLSQYRPADTFSTDLANVTTVMQSFCTSYQSSGNSTAMIDFADMLAAIQNAVPYCDYSGVTGNPSDTVSTSTTSASTSTTSTSTASTSTASTSTTSTSTTSTSTTSTTSTSTTSTSTTSSSSSPTATESAPPSTTYLGCYTDLTSSRTLQSAGYGDSTSMTISSCASFCSGYQYFGTEYSAECYCGNSITENVVNPASDCNMACSGDSTETCGGPNRLSLYQNTVYVAPSVTTSADGYSYLACYTDSVADRTLAGARQNSDAMTIQACADFCSSGGFTYMGTEYHGECYCGNSLTQNVTNPASDCNTVCSGDSTEICGGPNRLSLYQNAAYIAPTVVALPDGYTYVACYTDSVADRTLVGARQTSDALTIQACADFCSSGGFTYMGTEYHGECYCGNSITGGATVASGGEGDCDMRCSGDSTQLCGGPNRISLYSTTGKISRR